MGYIKLNHWFINNNELSISLLRFYVRINIMSNDNNIYFKLTVINSLMKKNTLYFDSLEEAISFTENTISNSIDFESINNVYSQKQLSLNK